jgi:hypothetical protein
VDERAVQLDRLHAGEVPPALRAAVPVLDQLLPEKNYESDLICLFFFFNFLSPIKSKSAAP